MLSLGAAWRARGRAACSCVRKPTNKGAGDREQGVESSGGGRARLNLFGDRRKSHGAGVYGSRGWNVRGDVLVGAVVAAHMVRGGWGVQEAVKPEYASRLGKSYKGL